MKSESDLKCGNQTLIRVKLDFDQNLNTFNRSDYD